MSGMCDHDVARKRVKSLPKFCGGFGTSAYSLANSQSPLEIDGSLGEGGGQILRTSVSLSAVTGRPIRIVRIRAGRPKPGLQKQHLCAVQSLAKMTGARLEGAEVGSQEISFIPSANPDDPLGRDHLIDIGSAGSTTLVFQTLLPTLLTAPFPQGRESVTTKVSIIGGTANPMAPPAQFLQETFIPTLNRALYADYVNRCEVINSTSTSESEDRDKEEVLITVSLAIEKQGFYPAGGGKVVFTINHAWKKWEGEGKCNSSNNSNSSSSRFSMVSRGLPLGASTVDCVVSKLPTKIAERQISTVRKSSLESILRSLITPSLSCPDGTINPTLKCDISNVQTPGPGNAVFISLRFENITEVVSSIGERGRPAEEVASQGIRSAIEYLQQSAPVSVHLADQLLLPLALLGCGGLYIADPRTLEDAHFLTNVNVISQFFGSDCILVTPPTSTTPACTDGTDNTSSQQQRNDEMPNGLCVEVWPV